VKHVHEGNRILLWLDLDPRAVEAEPEIEENDLFIASRRRRGAHSNPDRLNIPFLEDWATENSQVPDSRETAHGQREVGAFGSSARLISPTPSFTSSLSIMAGSSIIPVPSTPPYPMNAMSLANTPDPTVTFQQPIADTIGIKRKSNAVEEADKQKSLATTER
jgi:hypothetical protein